MAKYRIGVTEAGDAGIDLSWVRKMDTVDGAVVITKQITHGFLDAVLDHQKKLIVHATMTGYGGVPWNLAFRHRTSSSRRSRL